MKRTRSFLLLIAALTLPAFAQELIFDLGDTVQTPDERTGKIQRQNYIFRLATQEFL